MTKKTTSSQTLPKPPSKEVVPKNAAVDPKKQLCEKGHCGAGVFACLSYFDDEKITGKSTTTRKPISTQISVNTIYTTK